MKLIYLKSALKCNSFDVAIDIHWYPFFRVLVTIEPGRSLLQFVTTNCLIFAFSVANLVVLFGLGLFLFVPILFYFELDYFLQLILRT